MSLAVGKIQNGKLVIEIDLAEGVQELVAKSENKIDDSIAPLLIDVLKKVDLVKEV